jgi:hypothetical protein
LVFLLIALLHIASFICTFEVIVHIIWPLYRSFAKKKSPADVTERRGFFSCPFIGRAVVLSLLLAGWLAAKICHLSHKTDIANKLTIQNIPHIAGKRNYKAFPQQKICYIKIRDY